MKKVKRTVKYFDLNSLDLTGYEEVTGNELFLINGGRQVKGNGTKESEYVPSSTKPKESETSSKTTASENSNSSKQNSTQSNPPSQKSDTEQETQQSKPTCTAAEIAAAKGSAANAYFESQDKKRQENKKEQKNTGTGTTSNSTYSQSDQTKHTTNDQYSMAQKDYDEHYGKDSSEKVNDDSLNYFYDPHNESRIYCEIDGENALDDINGLHKLEDMLSDPNLELWATVRNRKTGISTNYYSSQDVTEAIAKAESVYAYEISHPPKTGGKWIVRTVSEHFVQEIHFKEDIENNYQAKKEYGYSARVLKDGEDLYGYTFYNNNGSPYILDSGGNKVTGSLPIQGSDYDIFPGSATKTGVDPDTLYKNFFWTCYTGPNNPKSYEIDGKRESNYDYKPQNLSEWFSYLHDKRYEAAETSGIEGALFNLNVANADLELAAGNFYNAYLFDNPDYIDRARSYLTMEAFAVIGTGKTIYKYAGFADNVFYGTIDLIKLATTDIKNDIINLFK